MNIHVYVTSIWPRVHQIMKVSMMTTNFRFLVGSNTGFRKENYYVTVSEKEFFALTLEVLGCFLRDLM